MFIRFRETKTRLQLSLVETRRANGKVRHEHIASLGSIEIPPSVEARIAFWHRLHERLAKLGNRVDPTMQGKLLGDVHARIPMVTLDEQQAMKLENAEADERFWTGWRDMNQATAEDHKALGATVEHAIVKSQAAAVDAAEKAAAAKNRAERIKKGEDVPDSKPLTQEDIERILREAGWTTSDLEHAELLATLSIAEIKTKLRPELRKAKHRVEKRVTRAFVERKIQRILDDD
jgi:hypothetical protein